MKTYDAAVYQAVDDILDEAWDSYVLPLFQGGAVKHADIVYTIHRIYTRDQSGYWLGHCFIDMLRLVGRIVPCAEYATNGDTMYRLAAPNFWHRLAP